jgi:AAA family ATP:ADP antiporter
MQARQPPAENVVVATAAVVGGLLIAQQVAGRALRDALFLSTYPVSWLSGMMLVSALVSVCGALAFAGALARRPPDVVLTGALALQTVLLAIEWRLAAEEPRLIAAALYAQLALLGPGIVSGFWSLVNERFDPHTARRVVGRIGTGASLGGVVGGVLAWAGARVLPVQALFLGLSATGLLVLLVLPRLRAGAVFDGREDDARGGLRAGLRSIRGFPFLRQLATIVALGALADVLLDYLLKVGAARALGDSGELARFFSLFYACVALLTLALQAGVTRASLERVGLSGTVSLQPATLALASAAGLAFPSFAGAALARGVGNALRDSLFRSGYELLYTPLPPWQKRGSKALVDIAADKLGALLGAGLVMLLVAQGSFSDRWLWLLALLAMVSSVLLARQLHHGYVGALEESLRSGLVSLEGEEVQDSTTRLSMTRMSLDRGSLLAAIRELGQSPSLVAAPPDDPFLRIAAELRSGQPDRIRAALAGADPEPGLTHLLLPLLVRDDLLPEVLRVLRRVAPRATGQLVDALVDPHQPLRVRRRIPRVLKACPTPRGVDGLLLGLRDGEFAVRQACGTILAWMRGRYPELAVPTPPVYEAVERELEIEATDTDEQLSHVFALLSIMGEQEPLRVARWAVNGRDARLRGTALEYLEQVLPPAVCRALLRRLGTQAPVAQRPLDAVADELMQSATTLPRRLLSGTRRS